MDREFIVWYDASGGEDGRRYWVVGIEEGDDDKHGPIRANPLVFVHEVDIRVPSKTARLEGLGRGVLKMTGAMFFEIDEPVGGPVVRRAVIESGDQSFRSELPTIPAPGEPR